MARVFLDTNVLVLHLLDNNPELSPRATAYLRRIEAGEVQVRTTDTVIFETVFTLQRRYRKSKQEIRDSLLPLIELPGIVLPGKRRLRQVFDLYVEHPVSFADAYHAVVMGQLKLTEIATFDEDFDKLPGITRVTL